MNTKTSNIAVTHQDKLLFPKSRIIKQDVMEYYKNIAPHILPFLQNRPLTMQRFPRGISETGFFQKNASDYFPEWIETVIIKKEGGWVRHVVCNTKETLLYLVNQNVLTFHIALSRIDKIEYPDKIIFDLDPPKGDFELAIKVAKILRVFLEEELGLITFVMTSGSKGLHIAIPIVTNKKFDQVHEFAKMIAEYISNKYPKICTIATRKAKREGRLYIDYIRNSYSQTSVSPYAIRALENAPIATPLDWEELNDKTLNAQKFTINSIFKRLETKSNLWIDFDLKAKDISNAQRKLKLVLR